ncbi:hypothetical protein CRE_29466 [Caenorhabditis remanei]|uniref:Uncharacterized protein n=1 Tax=Caenorhabditis remanei TaxID=31234 RepID=E3LV55_CAERE|nr:hypothetical protein CRE_29466 [Caenorhabditis remanei]
MLDRLVSLAQEIQKIEDDVKELRQAEQAVQRTERMDLKVSKIDGFHDKLRVKMDAAVQRKMEKLDEKSDELEKIYRNLVCMSSEVPTAQNFEEDAELVSSYCLKLKTFLRSDRSEDCPKITLSVEQATRRLLNNPV